MPLIIKGETYYRTSEACRVVGISRSTLLRWLKAGIIDDVPHWDRRGWRLFRKADIMRINEEAHKVKQSPAELPLELKLSA
ncbi:MAG: helix-turn-helix domain-containing protein [Dehalococcoidia bacterium]|jgi:excisionase family DNA binding protein